MLKQIRWIPREVSWTVCDYLVFNSQK